METTGWAHFLTEHARNESNAAIAKRLDVAASNITRWKSGSSNPDPQTAVTFARAYGVSPIAALVAAGYLDPANLEGHLVQPADLSEITTAQLLDELQRRLAELRETFDTIGQGNDRAALEAVVDALSRRHLPPTNVTRLSDHRQPKDDDAELIAESLADRHAALHGDDPQIEQEAPDTP